MIRCVVLTAVLCVLLSAPRAASADVFGFGCISYNTPADCGILENQMLLEVKGNSSSSTMVDFLFKNSGPAASSITDIYFSDLLPPLLGAPTAILNGPGVSFVEGCSPDDLPAGNPYGFTSDYCAESTKPTQPKGVNPGEWVQLSYTLQGSGTLAAVVNAIYDGSLRVGIKVQGYGGEGSETGVTRVPEPATLMLSAAGFAILLPGCVRRRRRA